MPWKSNLNHFTGYILQYFFTIHKYTETDLKENSLILCHFLHDCTCDFWSVHIHVNQNGWWGWKKVTTKEILAICPSLFSDITKTPISDNLHIQCQSFERIWFSSTPHHECTSYAPSGNWWRWYQTDSYGSIPYIQEELADLVNQEVIKAVQ